MAKNDNNVADFANSLDPDEAVHNVDLEEEALNEQPH